MDFFVAIDEAGHIVSSHGDAISPQDGHAFFTSLYLLDSYAIKGLWAGEDVFVEAFDKPLIAQHVQFKNSQWIAQAPYNFEFTFSPQKLCVDEWDRFHGLSDKKIPFVLSAKAQDEFFDLVDSFDDESITINGESFETPPFYIEDPSFYKSSDWNEKYLAPALPGWDLQGPHPALAPVLPQIKLLKSRVAVWGCGRGHDAAFLAQQGHVVRAMDVSPEALTQARKLYSQIPQLEFAAGDALKDGGEKTCDLIFEHTLFCAIPPHQRRELVQAWHRALDDQGFLLGVFFVMPKRSGPPYGCSEWELRQLLEKRFRLLYWKRWQASPGPRQGCELVVYAQKL